eukprot:TRINITY_DN110432_c0_g1_i1.p1 TRINITY_DN110432_c0_g1~~TRINITY_DN110432_c0_g1_i1.p1  ORF type:complete len:395 (+),score=86.75 TRINITY_DN110432_c0_g1_i1:25-1209(+)
MGNTSCCAAEKDVGLQATTVEDAAKVYEADLSLPEVSGGRTAEDRMYKVSIIKTPGMKLGLDVDYMAERHILPIMNITGGLSEAWNDANPNAKLCKGDAIVEINGIKENVSQMLEQCKTQQKLEMTLMRCMTFDHLIVDLEKLIAKKNCGPLLIRLSWHDAGVFSTGDLKGGCPNAAMRLPGGEASFAANAGLPTVALKLLQPISDKYCPLLISNADLWTLAANIAVHAMGGPEIPTRFGRKDAKKSEEGVSSQVGRLPDGDKGQDHLREIFYPKGFNDRDIVALSGAHTVGRCHADRSGFDGAWTEAPLVFDNSYFKDLLTKQYSPETSSKGCPQFRNGNTIMLTSDLALIQDSGFRVHVEKYAADKDAFFRDFNEAWTKLQELGVSDVREVL